MARGLLIGGGAAALIAGIAGGLLAAVVILSETPESHVERYLDALAADDLRAAARLAGLDASAPLPLGDEGTPTTVRVVASQDRGDGVVAVTAVYGGDTDAATIILTLEPDTPLAGVVPQWRFTAPPVARLPVGIDQHDTVRVAGTEVTTAGPGETTDVRAFIPARVTVTNAEPYLEAAARTTRPRTTAPPPVVLRATPSARLERVVERELAHLLDTCSEQSVLQPSGCPFGRVIDDDRAIERPIWSRIGNPDARLTLSANAGRISFDASATMQIEVAVQSLFDGTVSTLVDEVPAELTGIVVLGPDGPLITVYP